jgi:SAM-dependent methyltransferase
MLRLTIPGNFPLPNMVTAIAPKDAMFDGSTEHYIAVGLSALRALDAALVGAPAPKRILDLPCGHGRVTRLLRARFPDAAITCSDIDQDGVAFTAEQFQAKGVHSNGDFKGLDLGGKFDLIWVGSLLTHLSELMARQMLDCLVRHMAPGAILVMSSHGKWVEERLRSWDYGLGKRRARAVLTEYERTGYGYRDYPGGRGYGISLIDKGWIEQALDGSPLRLASYVERGWDDHQDILVLHLVGNAAFAAPATRGLFGKLLAVATTPGGKPPRPAPQGWFESRAAPAEAAVEEDEESPDEPEAEPHFDMDWYLAAYPDVAAAIAAGEIRSASEHYRTDGIREGRLPLAPDRTAVSSIPASFNDAWYQAANPDVQDAVRKGVFPSGYAHWIKSGKAEGRLPPPDYLDQPPTPGN